MEKGRLEDKLGHTSRDAVPGTPPPSPTAGAPIPGFTWERGSYFGAYRVRPIFSSCLQQLEKYFPCWHRNEEIKSVWLGFFFFFFKSTVQGLKRDSEMGEKRLGWGNWLINSKKIERTGQPACRCHCSCWGVVWGAATVIEGELWGAESPTIPGPIAVPLVQGIISVALTNLHSQLDFFSFFFKYIFLFLNTILEMTSSQVFTCLPRLEGITC